MDNNTINTMGSLLKRVYPSAPKKDPRKDIDMLLSGRLRDVLNRILGRKVLGAIKNRSNG